MKLADLATGSDWIVWIVFAIFAVLSIDKNLRFCLDN